MTDGGAATGIGWRFEQAAPVRLHPLSMARTDANSPVLRGGRGLLVFLSHYLPVGRSFRRTAEDGELRALGPMRPIRFIDDDTPGDGKWLEAIWPDPDGNLYGWYHAERRLPCAGKLFLPRIAAARSDADGLVWRTLDELIVSPEYDCGYRNGFVAGGYGDFSVLPAGDGHFYIHYSSYVRDPRRQGVCVARYPIAARDRPGTAIRFWSGGADWSPSVEDARPIWPAARGWQNPDPVGAWGPALHWNRHLGVFVALLNHTANGQGNLRQEGVRIAFNADLGQPDGWSEPAPFVIGGHWYPQMVGPDAGDGDTAAGETARLFIAGHSAWTVRFGKGPAAERAPPLKIDDDDIARLFGRAIGKN